MKYLAACLAYATATFTTLTTTAEIDTAVDAADVVYKFKAKHVKDGKEHTLKSKEKETLGVYFETTATMALTPDVAVLGGATFLAMFTPTKSGDVGAISYNEFLGATTLKKGDKISWNTAFVDGTDTGSFKTEWKYGKKPNAMLGFIFWTVLLLGVVGGAAYFLM